MNGKTTKKSAAKTSEQQTKGTSGKKQNNLASMKQEKERWYQKTGWIIFCLVVFFPVGIVLTWRNKKWNGIVKTLLTGLFGFWFLSACIGATTSAKPLEEIVLSSDSNQIYDINNTVDIAVKTKPEDYHIPKSAFEITGGKLDFKNDKIIFTSSEDGEFDICVKYSDVTSNTVTLKFEDKEAIEQARIAAEQAEQERIAAEQARIAQEQNQQTAPVEAMVWLSATGSKYHNKPNCGNMNPNNARQVTLSEAQMNYGPCKNCYR